MNWILILKLPFNITLVWNREFETKDQAERWGQENLPAPFFPILQNEIDTLPGVIKIPL
jgi:hypothetical protein